VRISNLSLDTADARVGRPLTADERRRCSPKGASAGISSRVLLLIEGSVGGSPKRGPRPDRRRAGVSGAIGYGGVERGLRLGNAWACQRFLLILPPPPALGEGGHRVLARSSWCPKANVLIHGVPTGAALTLKMRPLHSPEGREADARLRIS
jgi:hypothetical protein